MTLLLTAALLLTPTPVEECPPGLIHYMPYCLTAEQLAGWGKPPPPVPPSPFGVERWRPLVQRHFPGWAVNAALRVIGCETGHTYNPDAWNKRSGASGLFQHMPRYWSARSSAAGWAGYSIFHPEANVAVAAWLWGQTGTWQHWSCKP